LVDSTSGDPMHGHRLNVHDDPGSRRAAIRSADARVCGAIESSY